MVIMWTRDGRAKECVNIATTTATWAMYNLLMVHNVTGESAEAAMTAWFLIIHKAVDINYSEYDQEIGKVSFQDNFWDKAVGTESQEVIVEGLLDLSILETPPKIHRGEMSGGRYYDSENEDMSWASMSTEAWHDKIMGMKDGLKATMVTKKRQ